MGELGLNCKVENGPNLSAIPEPLNADRISSCEAVCGAHQSPAGACGTAHSRVTFVELFFDLVFVFAVTQLSHGLLEHLTPLGALQTAVLMLAVWWAWIDTAWLTNWLDPDRTAVRMLLFVLMLPGSSCRPRSPRRSRSGRSPFALAYVARQTGREPVHAVGAEEPRRRQLPQFRPHHGLAGRSALFWLAGALRHGPARLALWALAVAIETAAPLLGFWVPGLGRSSHRRLERRRRPHGRALRAVRHHRARRIDPGHRRRPSPGLAWTARARGASSSPSSAASPCGWSISTSAPSAAAA